MLGGHHAGRRTYTTIDRSKPSVSIAAAGGAATTKDGSIPVSVAFSDDVAGPYPSTWTCVTAGSDPCTQFDYSAACSVPGAPGKSTTFGCDVDASQLPDGPVTICVKAADASVPDNPSSADQSKSRDAGEPVGRPVRHGHARPERADAAGHRHPTPAPSPGTPDPGTRTPGATTGIPGGLKIGSLSILVPKQRQDRQGQAARDRRRTPAKPAGSRCA